MHFHPVGKKLVDALRKGAPGARTYGDPDNGTGFDTWAAKTAHPLARIECNAVADVQAALRLAEEFGVPVTVAGGRLDPCARTKQDGHLILDLRRMNAVSYDAAGETVTAGGGITIGPLLGALPDGVVTVTGWNPAIGMVGLTLGGGYGGLNGRFGLACDGLRGAQIVLANGEEVTASMSGDAELFWALRGGGTGFGVVTSLTVATYRLPRLLNAMVAFPLRSARQALLVEQELLDAEPDQLGLLPLFSLGPDGQSALFIVVHWVGGAADGEKVLRRLTACEGAQIVRQDWVPYRDTLDKPDAWPWGKHLAAATHTVTRLDNGAIEILVEAAGKITSSAQKIFLHDFHGAAARIPANATAFPLRTNHFVACVCALSEPGDTEAITARQAWIEEAAGRLASIALPGGYVNFLTSEEGERARLFYGASADRLRKIKTRVDPTDVFRASTGHL